MLTGRIVTGRPGEPAAFSGDYLYRPGDPRIIFIDQVTQKAAVATRKIGHWQPPANGGHASAVRMRLALGVTAPDTT
jgi:hypothetical protein